MTTRLLRYAILSLPAALLACASGPSPETNRMVNSMIQSRHFADAERYLDKVKGSEYGRKSMVVFYLDKGLLLHDDGRYAESDACFDSAETRMEELFTKSVSKAAGRYMLNDNTVDYAGEPFERTLTNVFRALNYVSLQKPYEAVVEARKVERYLGELRRTTRGRRVYGDDAFAHYLSALLYEDLDKTDDARISMEAARKAYSSYAADYGVSAPAFDFPTKHNPGKGELVFFHYNGLAPRKVSAGFLVPWAVVRAMAQSEYEDPETTKAKLEARAVADPHDKVTISFPRYIQDPYRIRESELAAEPGFKARSILIEPVTAIAVKDLQDRFEAVKSRLISRAATRHTLGSILNFGQSGDPCAYPKQQGDAESAALCEQGQQLKHEIGAAVEAADTRGWATLPAEIRMARLELPAGKHAIRIKFKDSAGGVVSSEDFPGVIIESGKRTYLHYRTAE